MCFILANNKKTVSLYFELIGPCFPLEFKLKIRTKDREREN